jgi:Fic family protein
VKHLQRGIQGQLFPVDLPGEGFKAFLPADLPPAPPIRLDGELNDLLEQANRAIGRLDGIGMLLPDVTLFLYFYIRKEAVLSSQIEGTQSSLSDLLLFESKEAPGVPLDDVQEVSNYVAALQEGLRALDSGEPLTMRLLKRIHAVLLSKGRGSEKNPGEFRRSQNWIHGTRPGNALFVPPPYSEVARLMGQLERFVNDDPERTPTLIKAALAHAQFETIHAFLDGNGRLGRLLITLILCSEKALGSPLLYLSLYFKAHRDEYYSLLQDTRMTGDWEAWLRFFLTGTRDTSEQAVATARNILKIFDTDRRRIEALGKAANSALRIHHAMQRRPLVSVPDLARESGLTKPTAEAAIGRLIEIGIVRQVSQRKRDRLFAYDQYLAALSEGTEPLL